MSDGLVSGPPMSQPRGSSTLLRRILPIGRSTRRGTSNPVSGSVPLDPDQSVTEASSSTHVAAPAQGRSEPSFMQHAQNLGISGGSFVNAGGNFVNHEVTYSGNITIHNHQGTEGTTQRHVQDDSQLATVPNQAPSPMGAISEAVPPEDIPLPPPRPLPIQKSCDIYSRLLAVKGRGFPLWIPGPSTNLPIEYRRAGIAIGDVGILTKFGSFDFLFNICLPVNHPINEAGVPDGFYPLNHIPLSDILRHDEFDAGSHFASSFVERVRHDDTLIANGLSFESSAEEGAILTMPHGAVAQDLASVVHFEDYMAQHNENWHKFIIGVRGRKIGNGDVRLVIGADMAPAWGMATFAQSSTSSSPLQLRFKPRHVSPAGQTYGWEYTGAADTKSGPSSTEMARLLSDDNGDTGSRYLNQSLFVRTLTATFEKAIWDELMLSINSARISARTSGKSTNVYSLLGTSGGISSDKENENTTTWTKVNQNNLAWDWQTSTTAQLQHIVSNTANTIVHPSNTISDLLMKMVQNMFPNEAPRMIIVKDQDWMSVLDETDLVLPSGEELYRRITAAETLRITITNNAVLLLESVQHENTFGSIETLPTEIQSPNVNLDDLPQPTGSYPTVPDKKLTVLKKTDALQKDQQQHQSRTESVTPFATLSPKYERIDSKIVLLGSTGVGKTAFLYRYTQDRFDSQVLPTAGASFTTKKVYVNGFNVRMQLWDTAGQDRFRSMAPMYYRGANVALLMYDITNASTFEELRGWLQELRKNCPPELIIYVVGSKADLDRNRQVTSDLARLSLRNWFPSSTPSPPPSSHDKNKNADARGLSKGVELFEVSAKDYTGIHSLFEHLVSAIVGRKDTIKRENDFRKRDGVFSSSERENELKKGDGVSLSKTSPPPVRERPERSGAWSKLLGILGMDRPTHS